MYRTGTEWYILLLWWWLKYWAAGEVRVIDNKSGLHGDDPWWIGQGTGVDSTVPGGHISDLKDRVLSMPYLEKRNIYPSKKLNFIVYNNYQLVANKKKLEVLILKAFHFAKTEKIASLL